MDIRNLTKTVHGLLVVVAAASLLTAGVTEGATITFDQEDDSGTISYDGTAGGVLVGTDILFQSIKGVGTDADQTIDCDGCLLSFNTGAIMSIVGNTYTFAGGGFFDLVGGSILGGIANNTLLVDGVWDSPVTVTVTNLSLTLIAGGTDDKHPDLLNFFFNSPPADFTFIESTIQIESAPGGVVKTGNAFTADLSLGGDADLVNSSAIPEPGTTTLFLLGLTGLAAYRRRQL